MRITPEQSQSTEPRDSQLLVDVRTAAKTLGGIGESTLRRWIAEGRVPVVRLGRRVLIRPRDLDALIGL